MCVLQTGSHVTQAGFKFDMYLKLALNSMAVLLSQCLECLDYRNTRIWCPCWFLRITFTRCLLASELWTGSVLINVLLKTSFLSVCNVSSILLWLDTIVVCTDLFLTLSSSARLSGEVTRKKLLLQTYSGLQVPSHWAAARGCCHSFCTLAVVFLASVLHVCSPIFSLLKIFYDYV